MPANSISKQGSRSRGRGRGGRSSSRGWSSSRQSSASAPSRRASSRSPSLVNTAHSRPVRRTPVKSSRSVALQQPSSALRQGHRQNTESEIDPDDDSLNEIIMAVDLQQKDTVGCCYYVARTEKMYFMEDVKLGGLAVVEALRVYIDPTVILVSTKVDETIIETFENLTEDRLALPFVLEVRPPGEFSSDTGKSKLASLSFENFYESHMSLVIPGDLNLLEDEDMENAPGQRGRLLRLAGLIDLESRITIGCAGALLSYLQRRRTAYHLPGDQAAELMFRVSSLEMFTLKNTMLVNDDTLRSLQILENESHPNTHNQGPTKMSSGSKEGLSLFGLFHHLARTPQGKHLLRQWFLRPSLDLDIINERLDTIHTFLRPENSTTLEEITNSLKSTGNMRTTLISLRKGTISNTGRTGNIASSSIWIRIRRFAFHALKIKETFQEVLGAERLAITRKFLEQLEPYHLAQVGRKISDTVDFDQSAEESRTIIREGIDEELDNMKRTYAGFNDLLGKSSLNVLYFPQIGFLITVPLDPETGEAVYTGSFDSPWECMFSTEDQVYFKSSEMREMDGHYGDLYGIISDREIEITHELAQHVLEYEALLIQASDVCGELDSFLALVQGAKLYRLCRPIVSDGNIINIKGGRHLLQELSVSSFVPNDTLLVGGSGAEHGDHRATPGSSQSQNDDSAVHGPSMLILTGPNYSGKSVYLKQVALTVYMAHIGSYVPAESAAIGLTDRILSRVSTRETVSKPQSAFMIDLQQISQALSLATPRSLLIIDEFGKGTDASDGAGLACAVFNYLTSLGSDCPKVIGATHFHEIFENNLLKESPRLALGHMQVQVDEQASNVDEQLTYLYNFREGRSSSSFGTCCAAMNGVPMEIVERADLLIKKAMRGEDLIAACAIMPPSETAELEEAERIARDFLEADVYSDPRAVLSDILAASVAGEGGSGLILLE